jgi:hypothetical protein
MRLSRSGSHFACLALLALSACGGGGAPVTSSSSTSGTQQTTPPPASPPVTPPPAIPPPPVTIAPPAPTTQQDDVQLSATSYTAAQSAGSVSISVTRVNGSTGAASVSYATSNGTAVAGQNYTVASGTLSWADSDSSAKSIPIALSATPFSGAKTFTITLSNASGIILGVPSSATVTINGSGAAGGTGGGTTTGGAGTGVAAQLALKLALPSRLLLGLGAQGSADPIAAVKSQGIKIDIYERYLGTGDWTVWNSPPCDYVCVVATAAASVGAVPMYTYYQMANNGDGNLSGLTDSSFMTTYWSRVKLLFTDIAATHKPALVNFEPDFWGYTERMSPGSDPTQMAALVTLNADCAALSNDVKGVAGCLLAMARKYAPNAYVGFSPSSWGGNSTAAVVAFMNAVGAQAADFVVEQTLDRDAGCFEVTPQPAYCVRTGTFYWDESNQTHPNFQDNLTEAQAFHAGIGNLPIIWWQTPLGVPSSSAGGSDFHYRDNRVHYFLTHPGQLTAVGGLGVVFSTGETHQTNITTDSGQFQLLSGSYMAAPAALP